MSRETRERSGNNRTYAEELYQKYLGYQSLSWLEKLWEKHKMMPASKKYGVLLLVVISLAAAALAFAYSNPIRNILFVGAAAILTLTGLLYLVMLCSVDLFPLSKQKMRIIKNEKTKEEGRRNSALLSISQTAEKENKDEYRETIELSSDNTALMLLREGEVPFRQVHTTRLMQNIYQSSARITTVGNNFSGKNGERESATTTASLLIKVSDTFSSPAPDRSLRTLEESNSQRNTGTDNESGEYASFSA